MSDFFGTRFKLPVHLVQLFLAVVVLVLSIVRMTNQPPGVPSGQSGTMALGMSAKSIVIMLYQISTEHVRTLKQWSSLKAYWILNALEVVFWGAVAFMTIQRNMKICVGLSCGLGWAIVVISIMISILASYMTIVTWRDWKRSRTYGTARGERTSGKTLESQSYEGSDMNDAMHYAMSRRQHQSQSGPGRLQVPRPAQPVRYNQAPPVYYESDGYHNGSGGNWR